MLTAEVWVHEAVDERGHDSGGHRVEMLDTI
jgi:hypothetical protein